MKIVLNSGPFTDSLAFVGCEVHVETDRPMGSRHPRHGFVYPVSYGYIPGTLSGDGEALDAYILGIDEPLTSFRGMCVAVIRRMNDPDDKLIVTPPGWELTDEDIRSQTQFQEQFFKSRILR